MLKQIQHLQFALFLQWNQTETPLTFIIQQEKPKIHIASVVLWGKKIRIAVQFLLLETSKHQLCMKHACSNGLTHSDCFSPGLLQKQH